MTSRTSRHRPRAVLAALTLTLAAGVSAVVAGPANAAPTAAPAYAPTSTSAPISAGHTLVPLKAAPKAVFTPNIASPTQATSSCATVRAELKQYAARHVQRVSCTTVALDAVQPKTPPHAGARLVTPMTGSWCGSRTGIWLYSRTENCIVGYGITGTTYDTTGRVVGTAHFSVNQDIILSTSSDIFVENDTIKWDQFTGEVAPGTLSYLGGCTSRCSAMPGANGVVAPFSYGSTVTVHFAFEDVTGTAAPDSFTTNYSMGFDSPGIISINTADWRMPVTIRCDNLPPRVLPGCVFPAAMPQLVLSEATWGAAAANVLIGEYYLAGTPGYTTATPLTRGDPNQNQGNRDAVCDSTFVPNPTKVPTDSCDEYPFAASQQSGGQLGLTGVNCLEAMPQLVNGVWYANFQNTRTGTQRCERGHVPLSLNTGVGSQLGALYTNNRMLLGDAYTVLVTV